MKYFKIIASVLFVMLVAFLVARGCWNVEIKISPKKTTERTVSKKKGPVKKVKTVPSAVPASTRQEQVRMAIILDDWGHNLALVKKAEEIERPVTLSILPNLPHSREIAEEASAHGLGVMLHMPMQPKSLRQPLEPQTILTTTPDAKIVEYLDKALENVPHVEGVNNHQGSAATGDEHVMRTVLGHLKKKGLFFVDSQVIATSVGAAVAKELGVPFAKRDVFIDNTPALEAVQQQLRAAQKIALTHGRVVVIGHDKKVTLEAIRLMVPELEKNGVQLVLAKDLLE